MILSRKLLLPTAVAMLGLASLAPVARAAKGDYIPLTSGSNYDRNASVVYDGSNDLWLFFARSEAPADRLATPPANVDNMPYDLYFMRSTNNGKTWGTPTRLAVNPDPTTFRGRTIAATRRADGTIFVFWASGGNGGNLYAFKKAPADAGFVALPGLSATSGSSYFNVEAVSVGQTVYVYYEDGNGSGVYVRTFDGTNFSTANLVSAGNSIPKVIVDRSGTFRMAVVTGNTYPVVSVLVSSSTDGIHWGPATVVVAGDGTVTNWDPNLTQTPDGTFYLFWAPDQGDGRQRIEVKSSPDCSAWSASEVITEGTDGETAYWDYWPESLPHGNKVSLFYTSERGLGGDPGTGHILTTRIQ